MALALALALALTQAPPPEGPKMRRPIVGRQWHLFERDGFGWTYIGPIARHAFPDGEKQHVCQCVQAAQSQYLCGVQRGVALAAQQGVPDSPQSVPRK